MDELKGGDLKRACLVPSSVFASPDEVVRSERLSLAQKLAVLRRWEFDARRVAGFAGDPERLDASILQSVQRALQRLGADALPSARTIGRKGVEATSKVFADDRSIGDPAIEPPLHVGGRGALGGR